MIVWVGIKRGSAPTGDEIGVADGNLTACEIVSVDGYFRRLIC